MIVSYVCMKKSNSAIMYKVILFSQAYIYYINMLVAIIRYPLFDIHIDYK